MLELLRPTTKSWLTSKFEIIGEFDFLSNDQTPATFYKWCERWSSHVFAPNQRIVIYNIDTDYYNNIDYSDKLEIGNNTYNFFSCCSHFYLPTEFFIIISSQHGIHREVETICKKLNLQKPTIIESLCLPLIAPTIVDDIDFSIDSIDRHFVCINGSQRTHRLLLLSHLKEKNLLDCGYVSYNFSSNASYRFASKTCRPQLSSVDIVEEIPVILRTTVPFTRINEVCSWSEYDHRVYNNHAVNFIDHTKLIDGDRGMATGSRFQPSVLKNGLVYVVSETVFNYPYPWISEKIMQGILSKRPFIVVGSPFTLQRLRNLGFKTFSSLWDEAYDSITDPSERMSAIVDLLENICSQSNLRALSEQAKDIADFNFNHYIDNFISDDHLDVY